MSAFQRLGARAPRAAMLAAALVASACVPEFDTDLSQLTAPRLLAIASSPAETQARKEVELQALVATPEGTSSAGLDWTMCLSRKPLTELGAVNPVCLEPDDGSGAVLSLGGGERVTAALHEDVCKLFGPQRPTQTGTQAAGRPMDPDITGGFYQPFAATLDGTPSLGAVRIDCDPVNVNRDQALAYRQQYRVNENPTIASLSRLTDDGGSEPLPVGDGAPVVELSAGERLALRVEWAECATESRCGDGLCTAFEDPTTCSEDCSGTLRGCTGSEPYVWYNRETERVEPRREGVSVAWYASRGRFASEQTGLDESEAAAVHHSDNTWLPGSAPGPATLWIVIRDSRGGQSWQTYRLEVTP